MERDAKVSDLVGHTMRSVENRENDEIVFTCDNGEVFKLYHDQNCCETVMVEDVVGDLADLVGAPLLMAEEVSSDGVGAKDEYDESFTWTFYKFGTIKGYVDIRWYGTSNGYYSESVSFARVEGPDAV
jgi:hypothetical protein